MPRVLIFCGTYAALDRYALEGILVMEPSNAPKRLKELHDDTSAIMAVGADMAHGWRAPRGTFVVFDQSWHYAANDPMTIQALNRSL